MGADTSSSRDEMQQKSSVWGGQSPFLEGLYQEGANLYQQFQPQTEIPGQAQAAWGQQLNPQTNPYLNDMTQVYRDQLGQADRNTGGQAVLAGGYGGGRHGVGESLNQQNYASQVGNFLGSQYQGDMNRANAALGMTGQMMNLSPWAQQQQALNAQAGILGGPTVLGEGSSSGKSSSFGFGAGGGK